MTLLGMHISAGLLVIFRLRGFGAMFQSGQLSLHMMIFTGQKLQRKKFLNLLLKTQNKPNLC
jgi:hypothetical protein